MLNTGLEILGAESSKLRLTALEVDVEKQLEPFVDKRYAEHQGSSLEFALRGLWLWVQGFEFGACELGLQVWGSKV